jgi:hypothetical protein
MFGPVTRGAVSAALSCMLACASACSDEAAPCALDAAVEPVRDASTRAHSDGATDAARPEADGASQIAQPATNNAPSTMSSPAKDGSAPTIPGSNETQDGDAGPDAPADVTDAEGCPVVLAPCLARLRELKQTCSVTGAACQTAQTEQDGIPKFERCYSNGVHVTLEITEPGQVATVLKEDGSLCTRIEYVFSSFLTYATVFDPAGDHVLTIATRDGFEYQSIMCADAYADVPLGRGICGDIQLQPSALACDEGACDAP